MKITFLFLGLLFVSSTLYVDKVYGNEVVLIYTPSEFLGDQEFMFTFREYDDWGELERCLKKCDNFDLCDTWIMIHRYSVADFESYYANCGGGRCKKCADEGIPLEATNSQFETYKLIHSMISMGHKVFVTKNDQISNLFGPYYKTWRVSEDSPVWEIVQNTFEIQKVLYIVKPPDQ